MSNLQVQEDRWQIQQLLCRWCEAVQSQDWDAIHQVFREDTICVVNGIEYVGVETLIAGGKANMTRKTIAKTQLNVSNFRIQVEGDQASCTTNHYVVHSGAGDFAGQLFSMWGEYRDSLLRTDQGWRIARRDYTTFFTEGDHRMVFAGEESARSDEKG